MKKEKTYRCSICGKKFIGFGNNAEPLNKGRCCNSCNDYVVAERIKRLRK